MRPPTKSSSPLHPARSRRPAAAGFSLIEAVIAMGIVSFAMVSILGLLPVGLSNFQNAMQLTVESTIVQSVASDLQRTPSDRLAATNLYFDEQGIEVAGGSADAQRVYTVQVAAPRPLDAENLVPSDAASSMLLSVNNRARPALTNHYSVIVPRGQ